MIPFKDRTFSYSREVKELLIADIRAELEKTEGSKARLVGAIHHLQRSEPPKIVEEWLKYRRKPSEPADKDKFFIDVTHGTTYHVESCEVVHDYLENYTELPYSQIKTLRSRKGELFEPHGCILVEKLNRSKKGSDDNGS
jgi:hypothetical protein